jgi:hypothetical protein
VGHARRADGTGLHPHARRMLPPAPGPDPFRVPQLPKLGRAAQVLAIAVGDTCSSQLDNQPECGMCRCDTPLSPAPDASDQNHGSSGPWLPNRLCCPAGSSLTMATSTPLTATRRLMHSSARLAGSTRQPQRVPNLLCPSISPMPSPLLRWSPRLLSTMSSSRVPPSPLSDWLGNHKSHVSGPRGSFNEAAAFT